MKVAIDKAGRLVIPKELRDRVGIAPGEVDIVVEGAGLRIEVEPTAQLVQKEGRLVVDSGLEQADLRLTVDYVRELRLADQR